MELYLIQVMNKPSSSGHAKRSRRRIDNLRNRPLSDDDMEAITGCIPELYSHIDQASDLSSLTLVDKQLLTPPKDFMGVPPLQTCCRCCGDPTPPPVKPPAVMTTADTVLFQVFSGSLVTPAHPDNLTSAFRRKAGNQYDLVEVNGQQLPRVISRVQTTWKKGGQMLRRQWRVSLYTTDGQMMLSVFCSFPGGKVRRRFDFSDGAPSPSTEGHQRKRKADVDETIGSPPRCKPRLSLRL